MAVYTFIHPPTVALMKKERKKKEKQKLRERHRSSNMSRLAPDKSNGEKATRKNSMFRAFVI
jgi:hypothetical protein